MAITMTRKGFLGALGGGTVVLWLQACGGGDGDDDDDGPMQCGASGAGISANHGHSLTIPEADLTSATDKVYSIQGSAGHDHTVVLTVAQLAALRGGASVDVTSSNSAAHTHVVTARCT